MCFYFQVHLGVVEEDPPSLSGVIHIMEHKYVPRNENETLHTILCHGDGLSNERMTDAHRACVIGHTETEKLQGLQPVSRGST